MLWNNFTTVQVGEDRYTSINKLNELSNLSKVQLTSNVAIIPIIVPHRDEYSETVGYKIIGPAKSVLFIPDIDKWDKWEFNIIEEIEQVDYALLDATFYSAEEIENRDMNEIPHPLVVESMELFSGLSLEQKAKIHFIHLNHSNPLLNENGSASQEVETKGFNTARFLEVFQL